MTAPISTIPTDDDRPVSLEDVLLGGQAFTWRPDGDGGFVGPLGTSWVRLHADPSGVTVDGTGTAEVATYLDVDGHAPLELRDDGLVGPLALRHRGLRVLRQDPWVGLLGFLTSPVNNVPRIAGLLETLGRAHGPRAVGDLARREHYGLPDADAVAGLDEADLRRLGFGFRAPRILAAARAVVAGELDLDELRNAPTHRAREGLLELDGVGPKVAECVLAFALHKRDCFPVDRWVHRAVCALAFGDDEPTMEEVRRWGQRRFGEHAAIAQQVMFHAARHGDVPGCPPSAFRGGVPGRGTVSVELSR